MSEDPNVKVCPYCAETIKTAAKVCPHCRSWQKLWSLQNPQVWVSLWTALWLAILCCASAFVEKIYGPKEQFAEYRDQISVLGFQVSQRAGSSNLLVTVVGTLTNRSGIGWKDVGVEARFLDKSGKMFDAITVNANDYRGVTILPHGETAFKIEGRAASPESAYDKCQAFVRWAKDVDEWP
jgi:hypothetical protein